VAETRTVEIDDPVCFGGKIDQPAGFEILDHAAVAVKKNRRFSRATFNVV
jgi:hypothetical protein